MCTSDSTIGKGESNSTVQNTGKNAMNKESVLMYKNTHLQNTLLCQGTDLSLNDKGKVKKKKEKSLLGENALTKNVIM